MTALRAYSTPGLGAFVHFDGPTPKWLALYGHGLDGKDLVLSGNITLAGTAALSRRQAALHQWPDPKPRELPAGTAVIAVSPDLITLTLSLDRAAIGGPGVDFSPPPETHLTISLKLTRLA